MLPSCAPSRVTEPVNAPKRASGSSVIVPTAEAAATVSPWATRPIVAVTSPERCICQLIWFAITPEVIAKCGTSGMPTSIDMLGRSQPPERNSWL